MSFLAIHTKFGTQQFRLYRLLWSQSHLLNQKKHQLLFMKTQNEIRQTIMRLKPELSKRFFVSKIGLFGSVTRGDFSAQNDIDLVVDFDKPVGIEFVDLADFLEEQLQRRVDLLSLKGIKPTFFEPIKTKIEYV
jgi:predicted nucleotidyltransferase